ncbi:MAG: IPT/TIG domain-containing protein [Deltaproteobacteria bacterium]|nr:IPT/TIG domain-containing protein [Deltaproteobacteria bacterium]
MTLRRHHLTSVRVAFSFALVAPIACSTVSSDDIVLATLSPVSGPAGTAVTLKGVGFGATSGSGKVTFNGYAAAIIRWNANEVVALVPSSAGFGTSQVKVHRDTRASSPLTFAVTDGAVSAPRPDGPPPITGLPGEFTPAGPCTGGRVCLTKTSASAGTLELTVVTQDLGTVSGAAFDLGFDPAVLRLRAASPGNALTTPILSHAAESAPGLILAGIAELKRWDGRGTNLSGRRTLWTLTFDVLSKSATDIAFMSTSRQVRDALNTPTPVTWIGGRLEVAP